MRWREQAKLCRVHLRLSMTGTRSPWWLNVQDSERRTFLQVETDWRLLTFDVVLPFDTIGFLAKVSGALADAKVPILVFSSFSTDHLLVREKDLTAALAKLREMGFVIDYC